jgi:Protein of unknown function (DUF2934)
MIGALLIVNRESEMSRNETAETKVATPPASAEAIAKRAYELYLQRGSIPGYELEDWLQAEAEVTAAAAAKPALAKDRKR